MNQNKNRICPSDHSSFKIQGYYKQQDSFNKFTISKYLLKGTVSQSYQQQKITIKKLRKKKTDIPLNRPNNNKIIITKTNHFKN